MTGGRKWKAVETPSGFWELHDEDGYALLEDLTESEARDIAAIDDIKAERDALLKIGFEFMEASEAVFDWMNNNDIVSDHADQCPEDYTRVSETLIKFRDLLTSIKEQGDG